MLLRAGLIAMVVSVLIATRVAVVVGLRYEAPVALDAQAEPLASEGSPTAEEKNEFNPGEKLDIDDERADEPTGKETNREEPRPRVAAASKEPTPRQSRSASSQKSASQQGGSEPLPISNADWPLPTSTELAQISQPRYYQPASDAGMTLTIEALGLYNVPIFSSFSEEALEQGILHVPDTAYPWD